MTTEKPLMERGTWLPNVTSGKATGAQGTYEMVGDRVTMTATVYIKRKADAGGIEVTGWPFIVDGQVEKHVEQTEWVIGYWPRIRMKRIYWVEAIKSGKVQV